MTETIQCPSDKRLTFEAVYHPREPQTGEWRYSLGDPPRSAWYEIVGVSFNNGEVDADITEFVIDHCEDLLQKWEEQLVENA